MTVAEFARRIHCARPNVYSIFERYDIGVEQLVKISIALNHNFFDDVIQYSGLESAFFHRQLNVSINLDILSKEERRQLMNLLRSTFIEKL